MNVNFWTLQIVNTLQQFKSQNNVLWQMLFLLKEKHSRKILGLEKIGPEMFSLFKGKVSNAGDDRNKKRKMGWNIGIVSNQVLVTLVITQIANHMPHYCHIQFISRLKKKRKLWVALTLASSLLGICYKCQSLSLFVVDNIWNW